METKNAEITLDHQTRPVDLFHHEIYNLFDLVCAHVPNWSFGSYHEFHIKQLNFIPSSMLTPAHSSLHGWGGEGEVINYEYTMTVIRMSVATVTASPATKNITLCCQSL